MNDVHNTISFMFIIHVFDLFYRREAQGRFLLNSNVRLGLIL